MLRRLSIAFCLLLAFAMLQAHNFIPHHHDQEHIQLQHHHDDNDHHDNDHHDNDADNDLLGDFNHNADFGKSIVKPYDFKIIIEKPLLLAIHQFILHIDKLALPQNPALYHPPDNDTQLHIIFLSHSVPFRAPPALLS
jgi:hypothetical protein